VFNRLLTLALCLHLGTATVMAVQLDDPTRPPGHRLVLPGGKAAKGKTRWHLSAVYIADGHRSAVINGRLRKKGEMIDGARVVAILPAKVRLQKNKQQFTIRLLTDNIQKRIRVVEQ